MLRYYADLGLLEPAHTDKFSGYRYYTGRGGVVTPDDPIDTIRDAVAPVIFASLPLYH